MLQDVRAILFDMDGVLIDSEPIHEKAQRLVFDRYGLTVPDTAYASFKGMVEREVFHRVVREFAHTPMDPMPLLQAKNEAYRDLVDELMLMPGVLPFLQSAASRYPTALTTSSVRSDQQRAFAKFDLDAYFDVIVTAEDITRPKPDPEPYVITAAKLGVPPEACLVIEDSVHGVRSAVGAGCIVAGLTTSFSGPVLRSAGAHLTFDRFEELAEQLGLPL